MKGRLNSILTCMLCWFLMGCVPTKYIERKQYLLETPKNIVKNATTPLVGTISIDNISAVPPFDQLDFLYRVKSGRYLVDYYNGFLITPSVQLETILTAYLRFYGYFSLNATESKLKVKLTELYADYRDRNNPRAIIALQFRLTKLVDDKTVLLFDKTFRSNVVLKAKNTESLLNAWNEGLGDILRNVIRTLSSIEAKRNTR